MSADDATLNAYLPVADQGASSSPAADEETPRTQVERAYRSLRHDIIHGGRLPGERLKVEHLRQEYGVGAGTLREALALLLSDALVTMEGQRGYRVARISLQDLRDLTDTRVMLETHALRQSIRHGDDRWEAQLVAAFEQLRVIECDDNGLDPVLWEQANQRFHHALIANCGSAWTHHLLGVLYRHGERYRHVAIRLGAVSKLHRDVHVEHVNIYKAAVARQEARAALALESHIRLTCELLMEHAQRFDQRNDLPSRI
ncbi:FCD domain-containing protein [Hydrogenophaga sp. 5NK40-0174]|uniref:GntR family transcriptional regulator n=1 Tax=Hydrogenophaga sp. 5NK40-0174 TaxID=3127649 RepID=UPI00310A8073